MVRGYDPVSSDFTSLVWNYIFSLWTDNTRISLTDSERFVKYWLKNSAQTSTIYNKFKTLAIKPQIKLKKKCGYRALEQAGNTFTNDGKHFPTATINDEVVICIDKIENKLHLKQNLDRELTFLQLKQIHTDSKFTSEQSQRFLLKNLYESCYAGYKNYKLSDQVTKEMAVTCSKYLFFRKSKSTLPVDRRFRYVSQLADQLHL